MEQVVYAYVEDAPDGEAQPGNAARLPRARYTKGILRQTLQLMGCKPRLAHKAAEKAFHVLQQRASLHGRDQPLLSRVDRLRPGFVCVTLPRAQFRGLVINCLGSDDEALHQQYQQDFAVACSLKEQRSSVTVLLCGTSGTGKSTLASLLASRLGITSVVSTDSIRHMMRSFSSEAQDPLLWGSTYQAGEFLQRMGGVAGYAGGTDPKRAAVKGYKAQSEMVMDHLDRLITSCEARRESLLVEGVHLSLNFVVKLMQRHPTIVPFLVHISNEAKHMERFAVRARAMTLRAEANRYVKYLRTIRVIQDYLCKTADKHRIPKVDNTNVDRSIATIHATVLGCLRRRAQGESMLEPGSLSCKVVLEEYLRCKSATWSSRDMLELIRLKSRAGQAGSSEEGPSTSAASTAPKGPLSHMGDAAVNDNRSFYGHDSALQSSDGGSGGGSQSAGGGAGSSTDSEAGTGGAGPRQSLMGSVLDTEGAEGRSDED
ncbi:hypothetical protein N2152v2_003129 [Parachlorella kessleri]